jgi:hypothetical protein
MSAPAEIIERLKKLLRLARSSNPHEAQLALARAMDLAREHSISIDGLNPDEQAKEKNVTHRETEAEARLSYDKRYAWGICRAFFNVNTVSIDCIRQGRDGWPTHGIKTAIIGTASDIEIALYVFGFLTHHFSFCWRKHKGRLRNRRAFVHGMYQGIFSKLAEQMPDDGTAEAKGTELSLDLRRNYIAAVYGPTTRTVHREPDHAARAAAWAGYVQGRNTQIRPAVKGADAPLQLA